MIERQAARVQRAAAGSPARTGRATEERGRLVYQDDDGLLDLPAPKLYGRHQFENAGARDRGAARLPDLTLPLAAFEAGIVKAEWPARMQRLTQGKLAALAPPGSELWLDGGHNPDGGRAVAAALADLEERVPRPLVLIVGMLATKDNARLPAQFRRAGAPADRGAGAAIRRRACRPKSSSAIARERRIAGDEPRRSSRRRSTRSASSSLIRRRAS